MRVFWSGGCFGIALALTLGVSAGENGKKAKGDFEAFFKKLDTNMDGKLTKDEFLKMAERAKEKEQARRQLSQAYDKLDSDKKGVTRERFKAFLEKKANSGRAK
jgi:hypothetical protein